MNDNLYPTPWMIENVNWHSYPNHLPHPKFIGYYLVAWDDGIHVVFRESYWDGKEFDRKEVQYWTNINWPY